MVPYMELGDGGEAETAAAAVKEAKATAAALGGRNWAGCWWLSWGRENAAGCCC